MAAGGDGQELRKTEIAAQSVTFGCASSVAVRASETKMLVSVTDAAKAASAIEDAEASPGPPCRNGRVAWDQPRSVPGTWSVNPLEGSTLLQIEEDDLKTDKSRRVLEQCFRTTFVCCVQYSE